MKEFRRALHVLNSLLAVVLASIAIHALRDGGNPEGVVSLLASGLLCVAMGLLIGG